jgi:hypothetical protein
MGHGVGEIKRIRRASIFEDNPGMMFSKIYIQ